MIATGSSFRRNSDPSAANYAPCPLPNGRHRVAFRRDRKSRPREPARAPFARWIGRPRHRESDTLSPPRSPGGRRSGRPARAPPTCQPYTQRPCPDGLPRKRIPAAAPPVGHESLPAVYSRVPERAARRISATYVISVIELPLFSYHGRSDAGLLRLLAAHFTHRSVFITVAERQSTQVTLVAVIIIVAAAATSGACGARFRFACPRDIATFALSPARSDAIARAGTELA